MSCATWQPQRTGRHPPPSGTSATPWLSSSNPDAARTSATTTHATAGMIRMATKSNN